jgi:hypothetical protein
MRAWLAPCIWASKKDPKVQARACLIFFFMVIHPCVFLEKQIASDASLIAANNALLALPRFQQLECKPPVINFLGY